MQESNQRTRWQNAFVYGLVTTIMVLSTAMFLSAWLGQSQRALADRVDRNLHAVVCILQLGINETAPPRSPANVHACLAEAGVELQETP